MKKAKQILITVWNALMIMLGLLAMYSFITMF